MYDKTKLSVITLAILSALSAPLHAEDTTIAEDDNEIIEEITVVGTKISYATNTTSEDMFKQQSTITSVLSVIDNLPGVLINEGDTFGSDDWSTTVSIRGFQLSLDEQQIGITIDGIANGNSNYGGGSKANRYIDTENLSAVEVSQGTADISSRSNEALGGTLNFTTIDPTEDENMLVSYSSGDFEAQKYFIRYNSGEIFKDTYAWVSISSTENSDWVNQAAQNTKYHLASKLISTIGEVKFTGYMSYDDAAEDNYQRVSIDQFNTNPKWDRLTAEWTGIPYIDQLYRQAWSTLRENLFSYLKADFDIGAVEFTTNVYYHDNSGRGDWVPPYLVDVTDNGIGNPQTELNSQNTVFGAPSLGIFTFVDADGVALSPNAGCVSSITFPYGGAGPAFDPACYNSGAIPVGSFRHTHYQKQRFGLNADFKWDVNFGDIANSLRGGLWYEDYERKESRDWHKIIDSRTGAEFDRVSYWVQYDRTFPVETTMVYIEDTIEVGIITARLGVKKFMVDLKRMDNFAGTSISVSSDSDALLSAGAVISLPVDGFELFAGYAENFAAVKDEVLERDASALDTIKPETAENIDIGLRYVGEKVNFGLTYYSIDFSDRLTFLAPDSPAGIDFLIGTNGTYVNSGGIESDGLETSVTFYPNTYWTIYGSYTTNDSTYSGGSIDFPQGNTVFGSVQDMAVLSFDWHKEKYLAGLSTKWVDDRFIDADNTQIAPAYTVGDFYAGVTLEDTGGLSDISIRFTINNVFDESYLGGIAGGGAWIGAPRTAAINFQANF